MMNADEIVLHLLITVQLLKNDIWVDGIHLHESGKRIIANNLINNFNHSLESVSPFRWYI